MCANKMPEVGAVLLLLAISSIYATYVFHGEYDMPAPVKFSIGIPFCIIDNWRDKSPGALGIIACSASFHGGMAGAISIDKPVSVIFGHGYGPNPKFFIIVGFMGLVSACFVGIGRYMNSIEFNWGRLIWTSMFMIMICPILMLYDYPRGNHGVFFAGCICWQIAVYYSA